MRLTRRQLRHLIEAEVDKMRTPKGPNSRDDGERDLTEDDDVELVEHFREATAVEDLAEDVAEQVGELFYDLLLQHFSPQHLQRGTLENARLRVQEAVHEEISKLV